MVMKTQDHKMVMLMETSTKVIAMEQLMVITIKVILTVMPMEMPTKETPMED